MCECVSTTKKRSWEVLYVCLENLVIIFRMCVCVCIWLHWCCVFPAGFHSLASINVLWRMNFSEYKRITHANHRPPLANFALFASGEKDGECVLHKHNIFICAFKTVNFSYILSLIYVLWQFYLWHALILSRFVLFRVWGAVFFSIQTLLVWFLAASIKVYCSALDTFYNQKSLYDATHFVFWPLSTTVFG